MDSVQLKADDKKFLMSTYARQDLAVASGKGCRVYDFEGRSYLDLVGGVATCLVGHTNPKVTQAISEQAGQLLNISNLYYSKPQVELARKLCELSGLSKCFLCNSGTEANEAALKLAQAATGKKKIIAFKNGFHGRTLGSLSATWKPKYREPFSPLSPAVEFVEYGSLPLLESALSSQTAAVLIEPVQGEAGVVLPPPNYLESVASLCKNSGALLIVDEVQTGNGRSGRYFAYQHSKISPDIVTTAKGLANGVPIGACLSNLEFKTSMHGSTFGGNSLSCAAANATVDFILSNNLMQNATDTGNYFMQKLRELKESGSSIQAVRGIGLMIGVDLKEEKAKAAVAACLSRGLLINNTSERTLRFLPPLTLSRNEVDEAIAILSEVLK